MYFFCHFGSKPVGGLPLWYHKDSFRISKERKGLNCIRISRGFPLCRSRGFPPDRYRSGRNRDF